ncbi:sigma-54-dependent Fis family transcriptional regulator [Bacillus sp. V5-8f]|uniref:sigma-54 interaction domain-containing protein n=1 Tax=Bacillus sp. V5-8f TaxID=2053044 RepID=UPI000C75A070|nr:sigma 54-interacting transcriptional regulator [Bacillus sp. V5-8f]PLT33197.1 Fis family transcriptional regulator [Bacillus sp. V5-8f]
MKDDLLESYPYFEENNETYSGDLQSWHTMVPRVKGGEYIGVELREGNQSRLTYLQPLILGQEINQFTVTENIFYYPAVEYVDGRPIYVGVIPITALHKNIQKKLMELDAVIENSYDGIYISTPEGVNLRANKAIERLTGIKKEFFVGKSLDHLISLGVFNDVVTLKVAATKKPYSTIQRVNTGKETLVTGSPVFDEQGKLYRIITNVRDVSELHRLKDELEAVEKEKHRLEVQLKQAHSSISNENMIAQSMAMLKIYKLITEISHLDVSVLITGESGVGKEVVAEQIHHMSGRKTTGGFLKINCAAIPKELIESELFGYEDGAFTGAKKGGKSGLFEAADNGTLFLDEIGDLPLEMQAKLLRVLQDQEFRRIGGTKHIKTDARIIAATNHNLKQLVEEGKFRKDLYFRLNVIPIEIPPLRERKEDIDVLALYFLDRFNRKYKKNVTLTFDVLSLLKSVNWPGNVRELSNLIERFVVLNGEKGVFLEYNKDGGYQTENYNNITDLKREVDFFEQRIITETLLKEGSTYKAANKLGVSQSYIARRIKKYGIQNVNS